MLDTYDDSSLQYWRSYQFIFDSPNWLMNLLLSMVCIIIPGIGPILLLGYEFEIIEHLHSRGDQGYPDFDFGRFLKYLMRGVWVFLVQLIVSMVFLVFIFLVVGGLFLAGSLLASQGGKPSGGLVIGLGVLGFVLYLGLALLMSLILAPLTLYVGLSQELTPGSLTVFLRDFLKRVGKELFLAQLFCMVTGLVLVFLGLLCLYFGIFPAAVIASLSQHHLLYQVYQLYLRRGGAVIPLKVEAAQS